MLTILNQSLPLWVMFLPLGIAALLAAKLYQWQSIFSKVKANYQAQLRELQGRLDESIASEKEISKSFQKQAARILELESELTKHKLAIRQADDNLNDVRLTWSKKSEKDAEIIRGLNAQAVEREALISQIRSNLDAYVFKSNQLDIKVSKWAFELDELDALVKQLRGEIEQLESKLQLSELAHNETKADIKGLEIQFKDALSVINRTGRAKAQWAKICKDKATKLLNATVDRVKQKAGIVDKSVKFVTVYKADQGESDNGRHNIVALCNEVNRGIAEQAERIRQELEVVDMSQLKTWDSVKLRCGAVKVVKDFTICNIDHELDTHTIKIHFADNPFYHYYDKAGNYEVNREDPMDIIQIIKATK